MVSITEVAAARLPAVDPVRLLPVPEGLVGERADVALTRMLGLSRAAAADLIEAGGLTIDGREVAKGSRLPAGSLLAVDEDRIRTDRSTVMRPAPSVDETTRGPELEVLHTDADLVVVNKPPGMASHASPGWVGPTVPDALAHLGELVTGLGPDERQGIVHRLDAGTSGVMVVAKSDRAYRSLKHQFKEREVSKRYLAVVQGHLDPLEGMVDAPIGRHPTAEHRFAVTAAGRPSQTVYRTIEAFAYASMLDVELLTGRTHQIRVHLAALRHPCVGDPLYGSDPVLARRLGLQRQWLHAHDLSFRHPNTGDRVRFSAEPAADLATAVVRLREGLAPES